MGVRKQLVAASWIGGLSVIVPMVLGLGRGVRSHPALAPAGVDVLAVRAVHGGGDVDHRVSGHGAHSERAAADAYDDRPPVAHRRRRRRRACVDHARTGRRARRQRSGLEQFAATLGGLVALSRSDHLPGAQAAARLACSRATRPTVDRKAPLLAVLLIGTFACAYATRNPRCARGVRRISVRRLPAARRSTARGADRAHRVRRDHRADADLLRARRARTRRAMRSSARASARCC